MKITLAITIAVGIVVWAINLHPASNRETPTPTPEQNEEAQEHYR
jgi:hypothetical protein